MDLAKPWNDLSGNYAASRTILSVYRCTSSVHRASGDTDYAGIRGSALVSATWTEIFRNGVLLAAEGDDSAPISFASITDGASNTICIAESADRQENEHGSWADGQNIISHDNGGINLAQGEIFSMHRLGAYAARADGGVIFLSNSTDKYVVGALCTRNGKETVDLSSF